MIELFLTVLAYFFIGLIGLTIIFEAIKMIVLIILFLITLFKQLTSWVKAVIVILLIVIII